VFGFFGPWAWKQSKRFVENAKTGLISTSFLVLYLPFFLPIIYTLVFAAIELTVYPAISKGERDTCRFNLKRKSPVKALGYP